MLKISGPIGAALFATITLAAANARADSCAAAPTGSAPQGQHWYYHIDRATRHKCWYLHAAVALRHRAMIRHRAAAAAAEHADPMPNSETAAAPIATPSPAALAAAPDDAADSTPPTPHVTVLAVKTSTPFVATTSPPQTLPRAENPPAVAASKPAADTGGAAPQDKGNAFNTRVQIAEAATDAARTRTAEEFILLALALGVAAAVTALISKIVNIYRKPRISVDPDGAWLSFRSGRQRIDMEAGYDNPDVPFLDPQEQYGLADLHTQEWLDRPVPEPDQPLMSLPQTADFTQRSPRPGHTDIEPALRALRQARQSRVA